LFVAVYIRTLSVHDRTAGVVFTYVSTFGD